MTGTWEQYKPGKGRSSGEMCHVTSFPLLYHNTGVFIYKEEKVLFHVWYLMSVTPVLRCRDMRAKKISGQNKSHTNSGLAWLIQQDHGSKQDEEEKEIEENGGKQRRKKKEGYF